MEQITNEQLVAKIQAGENTAENMLQLWQQTKAYIYKVAKRYSGSRHSRYPKKQLKEGDITKAPGAATPRGQTEITQYTR